MHLIRTAATLLTAGLALGFAAPAVASVAVDEWGASVQGPESAAARHGLAAKSVRAPRLAGRIVTAAGGAATNLRQTALAIAVVGPEAR